MIIKLLAEGGSMKPGPALSQKLGPAGIPINSVIQKVNEATENFTGLKVPVELDVNLKTKKFEVKIFPSLNHLFQTCTSPEQSYGTIEESFSPIALQIISDWINKTNQ